MITLRKFHTTTKLLLLLVPAFLVTGCSTSNPSEFGHFKATDVSSNEPGPDRLVRYCRRMAETSNLRIAIGICQRALDVAPDNPEPVLILAQAYVAADLHKDAAEAYLFALGIDRENTEAHFGIGKLYLRESRFDEARPHLQAALDSGTRDPGIYNAMGILYDQMGQHANAQSFYHLGLTQTPGNTALANNLGVSLVLSQQLEEGVTVLSSLKSNRRPNMTARNNLETAQAAVTRIAMAGSAQSATRSTRGVTDPPPSQHVVEPVLALAPAPIEMVDFEPLPAYPARKPEATLTSVGEIHDVIAVAWKTSHTEPARIQRSVQRQTASPMNLAELGRDRISRSRTLEAGTPPLKASRTDLSKITPARKPISKTAKTARPDSALTYAKAGPPTESRMSDVMHLPIEMPAPIKGSAIENLDNAAKETQQSQKSQPVASAATRIEPAAFRERDAGTATNIDMTAEITDEVYAAADHRPTWTTRILNFLASLTQTSDRPNLATDTRANDIRDENRLIPDDEPTDWPEPPIIREDPLNPMPQEIREKHTPALVQSGEDAFTTS